MLFYSFPCPQILVVGLCPIGQVTYLASRDVDVNIFQASKLKREERLIISDDAFDRHENFLRLNESSRALRHLKLEICDLVNVAFGSLADLFSDSSLMSALGCNGSTPV